MSVQVALNPFLAYLPLGPKGSPNILRLHSNPLQIQNFHLKLMFSTFSIEDIKFEQD